MEKKAKMEKKKNEGEMEEGETKGGGARIPTTPPVSTKDSYKLVTSKIK